MYDLYRHTKNDNYNELYKKYKKLYRQEMNTKANQLNVKINNSKNPSKTLWKLINNGKTTPHGNTPNTQWHNS